MPLPTNNSRPAIPYQPEQILPNYNRYENLGQFPPTAQQLDGDMNRIIDLLNTQSAEINGIVVGALPGANDPLNANRLITTDGAGNISWTPINQVNLGLASVGTNKIINAAVTSAKIQPQAIQTQHIENNAVTGSKVATSSVPLSCLTPTNVVGIVANRTDNTGKIDIRPINDWQVPTKRPNNPYMNSENLFTIFNNSGAGEYNGFQLKAGSITALQIADETITGTKIANNSVDGTRLLNGSVYNSKLTDGTLTRDKIANKTITNAQIADGTITGALIANNTVTNAQILDGTITTALYANGSITGAKLANNTVTNAQILDGTITTALYANGSIIGAKLANNTVTNAQILDGTITTALYANGSITGAKLANNTVTNVQILDGTITGALIANSTIPKTKLQNAGQIAPFAMLSTDASGGVYKFLNIDSVIKQTSPYVYVITFQNSASSSNAIVSLTSNEGQNGLAIPAIYSQSSTQIQIVVYNKDGQPSEGGFDMIIYDF